MSCPLAALFHADTCTFTIPENRNIVVLQRISLFSRWPQKSNHQSKNVLFFWFLLLSLKPYLNLKSLTQKDRSGNQRGIGQINNSKSYLEKSLNQWILLEKCLPMRHLNQMSLEMCIKKADLPVKCACYFPEVKLQLVTIVQQSHCHCLENVFWRMKVFNHFSFLVYVVFHSMFSAQTTVRKMTSMEALWCEFVNQIKSLSTLSIELPITARKKIF